MIRAMRQILLVVAVLLTLSECTKIQKKETQTTNYQQLTLAENQTWVDNNLDSVMIAKTFEATNGMSLPYRIFTNEKYKEEQLPLFIHLHGRGERGTDNNPKIYNNIPLFNGPNSIVSPNSQFKNPSIVLVPQCSDKTINEEWAKWVGNTPETPWEGLGDDGSYTMAKHPSESTEATLELIEIILNNYNIDPTRIYITGLSMGGFGTWEFIARRPNLFAAAIPMAGYSDPNTVKDIKHIPIWIFHGDIDKYNPVQGSRNIYKLLKSQEANVYYTEYPETGHGETFQKAWEGGTLLDWIFQQKKQG